DVRYLAPGWVDHRGPSGEALGDELLTSLQHAHVEGAGYRDSIARLCEAVEADQHQQWLEGHRREAARRQPPKAGSIARAHDNDPGGQPSHRVLELILHFSGA